MRKLKTMLQSTSEMYSVVQFNEGSDEMFACIPDGWFVNKDHNSCHWPPKNGKAYLLRALSKEKPTESWTKSQCVVLSGGYVTYHSGNAIVKEKYAQRSNASSVDEQREVWNVSTINNFEHMFPKCKMKNQGKVWSGIAPKKQETFGKGKRVSINDNKNMYPPVKITTTGKYGKYGKTLNRTEDLSSSHSKSTRSTSPKSRGQSSHSKGISSSMSSHNSSRLKKSSSSPPRTGLQISSNSTSVEKSQLSSKSDSSTCQQSTLSMHRTQSRSRSRSPFKQTDNGDFSLSTISMTKNDQNVILKEVRKLQTTVNDYIAKNNRRLTRIEVTNNKVLVMINDVKLAINNSSTELASSSLTESNEIPQGFEMPELPLETIAQLSALNRNLKNVEYRAYLIKYEKEYCTPSKQSDAVIIAAYLKRFISLNLRNQLTLKDAKGRSGKTLYVDFLEVYGFLIDVMKAGYQMFHTQLKSSDAHIALRTVWGRTKQLIMEENRKKI